MPHVLRWDGNTIYFIFLINCLPYPKSHMVLTRFEQPWVCACAGESLSSEHFLKVEKLEMIKSLMCE